MTAVVAAVAGLLGMLTGVVVNRTAGRYPWSGAKRSRSRGGDTPADGGESPPQLHDRGKLAVRPPVVELGTALLFALTALRFGPSWQLPAFLVLAGGAVLLTVIDLQHHKLPNRVLGPAIAVGAVLLAVAALAEGSWPALLRAVLGSAALLTVFLVLALISPRSLGMGDVKLAALLGLYLGWLGWNAVLLGAAAGFVVQAGVALVLLAARRVTLRGELPFGPAMLLGAALVIGLLPA